ncbi:MAG: molybdopterin dinucleotide binding domain-containing protein [Gemmatimonadota bacterium]
MSHHEGEGIPDGRPASGLEAHRNGASRRDFLKVLGIAGAGTAATACGPPDAGDKLIPYLIPPQDIVPGTNTTYATALRSDGPEPLGLHAWVRDGRVIKLEGNPDFPTNRGRLSALAQSALQDLYDPDRLRGPKKREGDALIDATWEEAIAAAGTAISQDGVVLLTSAVTGTSDRFFDEWAGTVGSERVRYESFGYEALREAHRIAFGRPEIPSYELDRADRIVCFGADFLETWLAPVELAGRFARARDIEAGRHAKFTFVGPRLSTTGTNADEWLPARRGSEGLVALAVARVVADRRGGPRAASAASVLAPYAPESVAEATGVSAERIERLGAEIAEARFPIALPPGVAAQGPAATEAHLAAAILNFVSGAIGTTVRFGRGPVRGRTASFAQMQDLVSRMESGAVRTLIVVGPNPAFTLPKSSGFAAALSNVPNVISLNPQLDETTAAAGWALPSHHELEAWGDAEAAPGTLALAQPVMRPLFDTRQAEDILMQVAAAAGHGDFGAEDFRGYLQNAWRELHTAAGAGGSFEAWWREALKRGGWFAGDGAPQAQPEKLTVEAASYRFGSFVPAEDFALIAYPTVQFYDGRGANRSWMQELPDPVSRLTWGTWVEIHPETAEPLGISNGDVIEVRSSEGSLQLPAYLYRGIRPDAVAIPLGQGHTAYGRTARGRGADPLDLLGATADPVSGAFAFGGASVRIRATGVRTTPASVQGSDVDRDREIAEVMGIEAATRAIREHHVDMAALLEAAYDSDPKSPYRWGMTIDLNACTGCGACVTACYAENNIPTVGEELTAQGRELAWLQVHRYHKETEDGFHTVHEPVLCQQCGDAPCEPVCPVFAAYHTPEGLNAQVYNRCVGTRYCANNCPYKVRRFNWYTYEFPHPLNMQLNPDVTVRQKGVMEKCTFCVQRINRAKISAKQEGRQVRDGEVMTACMQSCPTEAIVFGNLKDPKSRVSRIAKGARAYHLLGELGTRPAVTYLKSVTHAAVPDAHGTETGEGHDPDPG